MSNDALMLDRASMREALAAEREARGQAPVRGAEEEIAPVASEDCLRCGGTGVSYLTPMTPTSCPECNGTGVS